MKKTTAIFLTIFFSLLTQTPSFASDLQPIFQTLAGSDAQEKNKALLALKEQADLKILPILEALKGGEFYKWEHSGNVSQAVLLGEKVETENDELTSLINPLTGETHVGSDGKKVMLSVYDIERLSLDSEGRQIIETAIQQIQLFHGDKSTRESIAVRMGHKGDASVLPLLNKAFAQEKDKWTRHSIQQSIFRLKLYDPDPEVRQKAAAQLGEIKGLNSLPQLKTLLEKGGEENPSVRAEIQKTIDKIENYQGWEKTFGILFNGISLGSILLIMGLGLSIIFGLMGVINMAHGEMMMLGAYTAYVTQEIFASTFPAQYQDFYFLTALPLSIIVAGGFGLLVEKFIIRHLYGRALETLLVTWGLSIILQQAVRGYFGDLTSVNAPELLRGGWQVMSGLVLPYNRIFIIGLTFISLMAIYFLLGRTRMGLKIRAVTQNRDMSDCLGISSRKVDAWTFALGAGLAGLAGCGLSLIGNVDPEMGKTYIVDAFMVVVVGGVGKLMGTVAAAFGIGILNKIFEPLIGGTGGAIYAKVLILGGIILFLQMKPSGLFPAKGRAADSK